MNYFILFQKYSILSILHINETKKIRWNILANITKLRQIKPTLATNQE